MIGVYVLAGRRVAVGLAVSVAGASNFSAGAFAKLADGAKNRLGAARSFAGRNAIALPISERVIAERWKSETSPPELLCSILSDGQIFPCRDYPSRQK
jgi:hypothetical protein